MRDRRALLLGDDGAGERRIDVADHQHQVRRRGGEIALERKHDAAGLLGVRAAARLEAHIRRRDAKLLEEHAVHLAVVVLAGVDEPVIQALGVATEGADDRRDLHEIGPCAGDERNGFRHATTACLGCGARRPSSWTSARVSRMLARLEAPNTIERMVGCAHTYSSASRGGIAPEAITDMAMGWKRRVAIAFSYAAMPPHMRKPVLLMLAQTIGFSRPSASSTSRSRGRFMVMKPGSA